MGKINSNISIIDIADRIGVSKATVGHVLSGKAKIRRVSKETARYVTETAQMMGYQPNYMARSLRKQSSGLVSMIFNDLELNWADTILRGAEIVFKNNHYGSFIAVDRSDVAVFRQEARSVVGRRDEGVILHTYIDDPKEYSVFLDNDIPVMFIGDIPERLTSLPNISTIIWDEGPAIIALVDHLAQVGVKKIAFIGCHHGVVSDSRRYRTYNEAIEKFGIETKPQWTQFFPKEPVCIEDAEATMRELLKQIFIPGQEWPDVVFTLNDTLAITAMGMLSEMGIRCPEDVYVTGIGDIPITKYFGITTISEPLQLMGKIAAETMLNLIKKPELIPVNKVISHNKLNIRTSTQK